MRVASPGDRGQAGATILAALLLAFLAGLAGGVLAGTLITPRPAAPVAGSEPALARTLAALDDAVRRLGGQLEQFGRDLPRASAAPTQPLAGTAAPPPDLAPLIASVEQLTQAVRAQAGQAGWGGRSPALAAPMLTVPATPPPPERIKALVQAESDESRGRHLFWSYQQLLEAYGPPDYISIDGGYVTWQYVSAEGRYVGFRMFDGMVMDFWN